MPDPVSPDVGEGPSVSSAREVDEAVIDVMVRAGFGADAYDHMTEPQKIGARADCAAILAGLGEAGYTVTRLEEVGHVDVGSDLSMRFVKEATPSSFPVFRKVDGDRDECSRCGGSRKEPGYDAPLGHPDSQRCLKCGLKPRGPR